MLADFTVLTLHGSLERILTPWLRITEVESRALLYVLLALRPHATHSTLENQRGCLLCLVEGFPNPAGHLGPWKSQGG